jgi:hypothetical protein
VEEKKENSENISAFHGGKSNLVAFVGKLAEEMELRPLRRKDISAEFKGFADFYDVKGREICSKRFFTRPKRT